jgi:glycosyltransferase involved in cell wall biosynthesis
MASRNIEFAGRVSDETLRDLYSRCRALILPGEEDFGMTPVEALASGKPVIALGRGGVQDTVPLRDPRGGVFFQNADEDGLAGAIEEFERIEPHIRPEVLQDHVRQFAPSEFSRKMIAALDLTGLYTRGFVATP